MRQSYQLRSVLSEASGDPSPKLELFALVNLGLVQSLASGVLSATEAVQHFYNAENCLFVHTHFRSREANAIMSHGVQLPDLFDSLSPEEAQREFCHELETMRSLCLRLFEKSRSARAGDRATA